MLNMDFFDRGPCSRRTLFGAAAAAAAAALWAPTARAVGAHEVRSWPRDRPPPALTLQDLDGKTWSLAGLKGQPLVLNFWATWCDPCRAEMPSLQRLATRHRRDGLVVLAVNYKEEAAAVRLFARSLPIELPVLLDADGDVTSAWTPRVFPTTVLVARSGIPTHTVVGEMDWAGPAARELVEPLIVRAARS